MFPELQHVPTECFEVLDRSFGMGDGLASLGDISDAPMIDISRMDRSVLAMADKILRAQLERSTKSWNLFHEVSPLPEDAIPGNQPTKSSAVRPMVPAPVFY
ncbi:MAG: hypothetical protein K0M60_03910 [Hydrogenophaga sp.]|nr:hypothetical protein [Hydrogenophaga sp.]